jgi:MoaA/NifB/PqqE/SkfB family radical SAM enzyme
MVKSCRTHGISHHVLEEDYEFYAQLKYDKYVFQFTRNNIMTEVTDRCNADCPHCYHIPDSKSPDTPLEDLISRIKSWNLPEANILLAGAEPSLRKDFPELIQEINRNFPKSNVATLTNGIKFSSREFVRDCLNSGLNGVLIGLNHPSYLNNETIRTKQLEAIRTLYEEGANVYYIGYTMASISELYDIMDEIISHPEWNPKHFRIRYGSDIGRYPEQPRMFVSTIYKLIKQWCLENNKSFEDLEGDNNLYHVMVSVEGKPIRVIQWCDETDIHMEELRTGPYCDFVSDGMTNFLHQVIRRDVLKNKGIMLPDAPPNRYIMGNKDMFTDFDFSRLNKDQ